MKSEFLRGLGITDQSVIDAIFAENGKDIAKAQGNNEQLNAQVTELQRQLSERDVQLSDLKKSVKDNEQLSAQIAKLENDNKTAATEYQNRLAAIQKTHAIESGVRDAKAKNVKAVMALLDAEKITLDGDKLIGLTEQLTTLQEGEDTGFLFATEVQSAPQVPAGTNLNNPPSSGGTPSTSKSFAEAIANALKGN